MSLVLVVAQVGLVLVSWVMASVIPDTQLRSLLSAEGIRWFCGTFTANMLSPLLVWLLQLGIAGGILVRSRLAFDLSHFRAMSPFRRNALLVVAWEALAVMLVVALLTLAPHAILLSATGCLFPSSFSVFILPAIALVLIMSGITYGCICEHFVSLVDVFDAAVYGIVISSPLLVIYSLGIEFYHSIVWVVGI